MPVKIISEIGVNWLGNLTIAKEMIYRSKLVGADYVKFQMFNEKVIKDSPYKDKLTPMIFDSEKLDELIQYKPSIGFGVSTMYPEAFDLLEPVKNHISFIKIRYADNHNAEIARRAVKFCTQLKIPLLVSVNRPPDDYLEYNLYPTDMVKFLYCVPKYPPELKDINYHFVGNTHFFSGYSNHFPNQYLPMIAIAKASAYNDFYLEVHTKLVTDSTPIDDNVSLTFNQLLELCRLKKTINQLMDHT